MERDSWYKIQKNWEYLREELDALNLLDNLYSSPDEILTNEDMQRIKKYSVDVDRNEKLLLSLKRNPKEANAYKWFLEALKKNQKYIYDMLESTTLDPPVSKGVKDTYYIHGWVRNILLRNFVEERGALCKLAEIQSCIHAELQEEKRVCYDWDQNKLREFIFDVFSDIVYHRRKKKHLPKIENLTLRKHDEGSTSASKGGDHGETSKEMRGENTDIYSETTSELCERLKPIFEKIGLDASILFRFQELEIDGAVFMSMKEEDWEKHFPEISFGKRRKLQLERDSFASDSGAQKPETSLSVTIDGQPIRESFHKFDSPVGATDCYMKGRQVTISPFPRNNMMHPVRFFLQIPEGTSDIYNMIGKEAIKFASACLNDRVNGTFHVGIKTNSSAFENNTEGEIVGVEVDKEKFASTVTELINVAFMEGQREIVFQTVRSPKFIPVLQHKFSSETLYVIEIDVIPTAKLVGEEAFFLQTCALGRSRKRAKQELFRLLEGTVKRLTEKEVYEFTKATKELTYLRNQQESKAPIPTLQTDLRKQILNLFTGGTETLDDEIHPILFLGPLENHMDMEYIKMNMPFIQYFDTRMVFDFDPNSEEKGLYNFCAKEGDQIYEVHTTDNFDKRKEDFTAKNVDCLKLSSQRGWVFCNGYKRLEKSEMGVFEWKQQRLEGFKEALRIVMANIPPERGIALIFLFSKDYEVLVEAADEILLKFQNQWIVLAEMSNTADMWKNETVRRHLVTKQTIDNRCVLGMKWSQVSDTFTQILSPKQAVGCELPTSTGAFCTLKEKDKNDMSDLEVISRNECDNNEDLRNVNSRETVRRQAEETFYRGEQVQWINFWFRQDHVLKRDQHKTLKAEVEHALKSTEFSDDEKVPVVTLLHQPGAGGTTSAMQILWDFRQLFRCCVVKKITEDTVDQIVKLREYGEDTNRRPPLVLVDNEDEEKSWDLIVKLEGRAKMASRQEDFSVFCAVLICRRQVNLPKSIEDRTVLLKHELKAWEQSWFGKKYEKLERKFHEDKKVDPQLLISFNILKTNFNKTYIKKTVIQFMKEIDDTRELDLLRYLSLINAYDMHFNTVPISCFDAIVNHPKRDRRILHFGVVEKAEVRVKGWETSMSTSLKILVNESSQKGSYGKTIRIISSLLAKEILAYILETTSQQTSTIMIEFLSSSVFDNTNSSTFKLLQIVKDIVKKRTTNKDGRHAKFSPLILHIKKTEGSERAAEVFKEVYERTNDAMIAQQIARFYIDNKNWDLAERYATMATDQLPANSLLWDTRAQVYFKQLLDIYEMSTKSGNKISVDTVNKVTLLSRKAIDSFQREQYLSTRHKGLPNNFAGYLGELRAIYILLETVQHFESFTTMDDMHNFLVKRKYSSKMFDFLSQSEQEFMKSLGDFAFKAIRKIEDETIQLKGDSKEEFRTETSFDRQGFMSLKENIYAYLGEDTDAVPGSMTMEDACEFRRRRVRRMGVTSLQGTFALNYNPNAEETHDTVMALMSQNVDSKHCTAFDLVTILNTTLAIHIAGFKKGTDIPYQNVLEWSRRLYDSKQPDKRPYLESFLYLILFHLPTETRRKSGFKLCSEVKIRDALTRWKEAFYGNYPMLCDPDYPARKKDTTIFFLGKGIGLDEIVYQKELLGGKDAYMRNHEFWQSQKARTWFQRIEGTLLSGGLVVHVQFQLPGGNKFNIDIPTSLPTIKRNMWQKRVFFVLGFSWSGPKAYDLTTEDPSNVLCDILESRQISFKSRQDRISPNLTDIERDLEKHNQELDHLRRKMKLERFERIRIHQLEEKIQNLQDDKAMLLGDD